MLVWSVMNTTNLPCKSNIFLSPNVDWFLCTLPWGLSSLFFRHYCLISLAFTSFCLSHHRPFVCHWVILSVSSILSADRFLVFLAYQIRGVVLRRKIWNKAFGDYEMSTRGIVTFFWSRLQRCLWKEARIQDGAILQTNCVENRSRMGPRWKICLLILDICMVYFIKRFKICIVGRLGIVAVF